MCLLYRGFSFGIAYSSHLAPYLMGVKMENPKIASQHLQSEESSNATEAVITSLPNLAGQAIAYSVFSNEKDNTPIAIHRTWADFAMRIQRHMPRKSKEGTGVFSPVTYRGGVKRGNNGVLSITMAVFDVDSGATPEAVKELLQGLAYVIHSTWSHTAKNPSYRVIVPFTTPVQKDDWGLVWQRLNLMLGGINDQATKDPARIYFLPSHPDGRDDYFVEVGEGRFLDPNVLPPLPVEVSPVIVDVVDSAIEPHRGAELGSAEQLAEVQERCQFVQWASDPSNQANVSEPLWTSLISNLCRFEGGDAAIHEASCHHPEYNEDITTAKIDRHRDKSGPITCARIQSLGFTACPVGGCKTPVGKATKSPAGLGCWAARELQPATERKLTPKDHVNNIVSMFNDHLHYVNGEPYAYSDGYWPVLDEQVDVAQVIAHYLGEKVTRSGISELLYLVQTFQAKTELAVSPDLNLLCLLNGTLDTRTGELIEHSPEHNLKCQINSAWAPSAPCPRWLQFLDEIFVYDPDKSEKIQLLQEWFGYCLTPDNSQHKFLWMIGAGGNGKSVLLDILTHLVGRKNVSDAHIERLGDKFVRAELEGKLVNISAEMSAEATIADGYLKSIVAGDVIEAERKFKPSFSFRPFVRLIGSTNHLPRLLDLSDGFFRRAMVLTFNRRFDDAERDPNLKNKLFAELPGILAWAVQGLKNLRGRGRFEIPSSSVEALVQYRQDSDPERMFVDECLLMDADGAGMTPNEIYAGYVLWCRASGYRAKAKINFGKRLPEFGIGHNRGHSGKRWLVKPNPVSNDLWNDVRIFGAPVIASAAPMHTQNEAGE